MTIARPRFIFAYIQISRSHIRPRLHCL